MKRFNSFLFVAVLFATSSVFAQGVQVIRAFNTAIGASNSARITHSAAARSLITQATSARIAGVSLSALSSVNAFESAITSILNSNDANLKQQANNFLVAVASATTKIGEESARAVINNHLNVSALGLSDAAQKGSLQVGSARASVTTSLSQHATDKALKEIEEFAKAVVQRKDRTEDSKLTAKLDEATSELKDAVNKSGLVLLGEGVEHCVTSWAPEFNIQVANLIAILAHTDDASTYREAYSNLSSGAKSILGVTDDKEINERFNALSKPDGCRAISPAVTAAA